MPAHSNRLTVPLMLLPFATSMSALDLQFVARVPLPLESQLPPAHSNCRLLMLMNFDIRITMTGGRVRLAGCSLDWFTEQRMHPGSETCFNMSSAMMMMVSILIRISNALFYYLYLWLEIKLWQDLSQFPDLASLFTFVNCQLKLRQLA